MTASPKRRTSSTKKVCSQDLCSFWSKCPFGRNTTECRSSLSASSNGGEMIEEVES